MPNKFSFTIIYTIKINQDAIDIDTNVVLTRLYNHISQLKCLNSLICYCINLLRMGIIFF